MNLEDLSEDQLLAKLLKDLPLGGDVVLGPGDDCAAVLIPGSNQLSLLKTDCIVEGVHFLPDDKPERVGWKALCRAVSDIGAMGGTPKHALVTLFSPPDKSAAFWTGVYRGLKKAAARFGVSIVGGETTVAPTTALSITLTGEILAFDLVTRSGGQPGDRLFVTGSLGSSITGKHLDFLPRLEEGVWLATKGFPSAMMDLSDGLGSDLPRLATASGCGFALDFDALPRNPGVDIAGAIGDGEDYELLFSVPAALATELERSWKRQFPKLLLTEIGELTASDAPSTPLSGGYEHFLRCQPARKRRSKKA